jgi:methionine salvage enolase-phosphatase E1
VGREKIQESDVIAMEAKWKLRCGTRPKEKETRIRKRNIRERLKEREKIDGHKDDIVKEVYRSCRVSKANKCKNLEGREWDSGYRDGV